MAQQLISRQQAKASGLKRYFTGKPCPRGHVAERMVGDKKCLLCKKEKTAIWRANNIEHVREYANANAKLHRDTRRKTVARWRANNLEHARELDREGAKRRRATVPGQREKERERSAANYRKNRHKRREADNARSLQWYYDNTARAKATAKKRRSKDRGRDRERARKWREENPERARAAERAWTRANPDKARAKSHRYLTKLTENGGEFTEDDVFLMLEDQGYRCVACGTDLLNSFDVDHIHPVSRGGSSWPDNLQILCRKCNRSKGAKTMEEWLGHAP